jgi:guanylate kinase
MREISEAYWYHYIIVNEHIEEAVVQLKAIIIAERCRRDKSFVLEEKSMGGKSWQELR